jgi:hypothetical protein
MFLDDMFYFVYKCRRTPKLPTTLSYLSYQENLGHEASLSITIRINLRDILSFKLGLAPVVTVPSPVAPELLSPDPVSPELPWLTPLPSPLPLVSVVAVPLVLETLSTSPAAPQLLETPFATLSVSLIVPAAPGPSRRWLPPVPRVEPTALDSPAKASERSSRPPRVPPWALNSSIVTARRAKMTWCLASLWTS